MTNDRIEELLRLSRAYCAQQLPWFAPGLFMMQLKISKQVAVAAVSKDWVVYWNPDAIKKVAEDKSDRATLAELGFIWIHELSHLIREHADRANDIKASPRAWNIACDFEINDSPWPGMTMPEAFPGLLPAHYDLPDGKLAEHYLALLEKDTEKFKKIRNDIGDYNEGSGVHGKAAPWEDGQDTEGIPSEIIKKATIRAIAKEMQSHLKNRGNLPGNWGRWAKAALDNKVNWRKLLKARLRTSLNYSLGQKIDYSYSSPSRRQAVYAPIITPRLMGSTKCQIACVIDTSGSISQAETSLMLGEVYGILQTFNSPVHIIPCDAMAYEALKVQRKSDILKIKQLTGGGGTDMRAGIKAALALKPKPDTIVVLTDGYTPFPSEKLDIQVIWGVVHAADDEPAFPPDPPWGSDTVVGIEL